MIVAIDQYCMYMLVGPRHNHNFDVLRNVPELTESQSTVTLSFTAKVMVHMYPRFSASAYQKACAMMAVCVLA